MSSSRFGTITRIATLGLLGTLAAHAQDAQMEGGRTLTGELSGATQHPGPGDPDGSGTFELKIDPARKELCYTLSVRGIQSATGAHIHAGAEGEAGPPVVTLEPPADGSSQGCIQVEPKILDAILQRPAGYYVNVHNAELPGGALRGQLGS